MKLAGKLQTSCQQPACSQTALDYVLQVRGELRRHWLSRPLERPFAGKGLEHEGRHWHTSLRLNIVHLSAAAKSVMLMSSSSHGRKESKPPTSTKELSFQI